MSLSLVSKSIGSTGGTVILESESQEELTTPAAQRMAMAEAASGGLNRAGLSNVPRPYPVTAEGTTSDELALGRGGVVAAFRADFKLMGML